MAKKDDKYLQPKILLTSSNIPAGLYEELAKCSDRDRTSRIRGLLNIGYLAERLMAGAIAPAQFQAAMAATPGRVPVMEAPAVATVRDDFSVSPSGAGGLDIPEADLSELFASMGAMSNTN